jgi:hypothetical protein
VKSPRFTLASGAPERGAEMRAQDIEITSFVVTQLLDAASAVLRAGRLQIGRSDVHLDDVGRRADLGGRPRVQNSSIRCIGAEDERYGKRASDLGTMSCVFASAYLVFP